MSNAAQRITELFGKVTDLERAEKAGMLAGIIAGLEMIYAYFDELYRELSVETMESCGLESCKKLFSVDNSVSSEEARQIITELMKQKPRLYESNEYSSFLKSFENPMRYVTRRFVTTIYGFDFSDIELLPVIAAKNDDLQPPLGKIIFNGNGVAYEDWDFLDYTFSQYEKLNSPFSLLDTIIKEDIYE